MPGAVVPAAVVVVPTASVSCSITSDHYTPELTKNDRLYKLAPRCGAACGLLRCRWRASAAGHHSDICTIPELLAERPTGLATAVLAVGPLCQDLRLPCCRIPPQLGNAPEVVKVVTIVVAAVAGGPVPLQSAPGSQSKRRLPRNPRRY